MRYFRENLVILVKSNQFNETKSALGILHFILIITFLLQNGGHIHLWKLEILRPCR